MLPLSFSPSRKTQKPGFSLLFPSSLFGRIGGIFFGLFVVRFSFLFFSFLFSRSGAVQGRRARGIGAALVFSTNLFFSPFPLEQVVSGYRVSFFFLSSSLALVTGILEFFLVIIEMAAFAFVSFPFLFHWALGGRDVFFFLLEEGLGRLALKEGRPFPPLSLFAED